MAVFLPLTPYLTPFGAVVAGPMEFTG